MRQWVQGVKSHSLKVLRSGRRLEGGVRHWVFGRTAKDKVGKERLVELQVASSAQLRL